MRGQETKSTWMLMISMAVFGTIGLFVRYIPLPSAEVALYRALIAIVLLTAYLLISREGFGLSAVRRALPLLLLSGAAMGFNWILLFEAYRYTTVSVATLSYYFAPILVTALSPILFRERMTAKQAICFVMATVGLILVVLGTPEEGGNNRHLIGIAFGLGAAVLYATVILLNKSIREVTGIRRTFWQFIAAAVVLIPYVLCTGGITLGTLNGGGWIALLMVGAVHTGVTYCLYFSAMRSLSGQKIAILSYIDPLMAVILSALVLQEWPTIWQAIGGAMILAFTLVSELKHKTTPQS